jgi:predicted DNA-binding transcriptional regulator AlpA
MKNQALARTGAFDDLLTPEQVCNWLGFSLSWLYSQRRSNTHNPIPCIIVGRSLRYSRGEVEEWLQRRRAA